MVEEPIKTNERTEEGFFRKYGWLIAVICGVLSLLFLFGTILQFKQKIPDGEDVKKVITAVNLTYFFSHSHSYNWTIFVTIGLLIGGSICVVLQRFKKGFASAASMLFFLVIPMMALEAEFFQYNSNIEYLSSVELSWGAMCTIAFAVIAAVVCLSVEFSDNPIITRQITEDGILIAAAFILNLIRIYKVPGQGGSINFQMLPLFIIALRHGPAHGLICGGILYGLITCLTDGYGFASYPFDYLIGFGSVMVMGFFRKLIFSENQNGYNLKGELFLLLAGVLATFIRFAGSSASSMVVYGVTFKEALIYNYIYIPVSGLISLVVIMAAYGPLAKVNNLFPAKK